MPKLRAIVIGLLVGIAFYLLPLELAWSIDQLKVEDNPNADLLPYSFTVEQSNDWGVRKLPVGNQIQVLHTQMGPSDTAWYIHAFNSDLNRDNPAILSLEISAHGQVVDWNPLNLTLTNFALFRDSGSGQTGVVALGYRNDSAYAAISMLGSDNYDFILLATGEDHSGDDQWVAGVAPLLVEDYDYDGHDELFLWVGPGRDLEPRVLVCLEPDTRSIEWSLPVAGALSSPSFYSCRDSANPTIIFATYNFKNGVVDENFDDNFCWLARVNNRGEILHRRIISEEHGGKGLWLGESDGVFYVFHALPMIPPEDSTQLPPQRYQLSRIDSDFRQLASVDLDDRIVSAWWDTYDPAGERSFYTLSTAGFVRVYDSLLNLLAVSDKTPLRRYVDTFRLEGMDETAYLFRTGSGMQFYSRQFEQLGTIDAVFNQVQALVNDDRGCVTHLIATDANVSRVYSVKRLGFSDFVRLLFWKYQEHILITLTVLALALVVVNMYRQRSARRLAQSERRLHEFFETSQDGFYRTDRDGRFIWGSQAAFRILGYDSIEEVVGNRVVDYYVDPSKRQQLLEQMQRDGQVSDYEVELRKPDGSTVVVSTSSSFYRDKSGQVLGVEGVIRDVTARKLAERALKESELRYSSLVESTDFGIGVVDIHTREFLFVNKGMCRYLGYTQDEMLKKSIETLHPPGAVADALRAFGGIVSGEIQVSVDLPFLHKDGSPVYFDVSGVLQTFDGRDAVVGFFTNVTERRRGQQALKESEDFNRAVIEHSPLGVTVRNRAGKLLSYNEAWRNIWRISAEDLHDYTTRERYVLRFDKRDDYLGDWTDKVRQIYEEGGYLHIPELETTESPPHGHLWLSHHFYALKDSSGQVDRVVVLTEDITERKQAEDALRDSEERFRTLAEATPMSLVVTNADDGTIMYANRATGEMLGFPQSELIGMKAADHYVNPADRATALKMLRETGLVSNFETRISRADGSQLWGLISLRPITFQGKPALFGALVDITDRREAQQKLREAEKARYDQVKQIAGGVAHEIYNALFPATSCLAKLSDRLNDSPSDGLERNLRLLELAESAVGRAINMTDLVTKYSRLDSERSAEPVVLRPLIDEVFESSSERIGDLGVDVRLTVADDVVVSCRADHLHSMFSNLLVNALDALEEVSDKQIKVVASEDKEWVQIRFMDTGPGIPVEHRARVFDPFFSTKPTRGTGLGLAIVKRIVELYHGRIELECVVDKGSIFVIFLKSAQIDPLQGDAKIGEDR